MPEYLSDRPGATRLPELAAPVEIDGRLLGVLEVLGRGGGVVFDDIAVSIFKSLAAQMAVAILEGQLYEAERRRSEQLAAIAQASRAVTSTLELDDLLDEVLDLVDERFGYERAQIFLLYDDQLVLQASTGGGTAGWETEAKSLPLDGPGLIALVGRTRQPVLVNDVASHPDYLPGPGLDAARTHAEMAAPLVMGPRLLGVFDVQSPQPGAFTEEDKQTL
ncbi:MAG: GAF domain-containing protein [Chloroflexi bacterium]|nr:GAF domain-containing protein [Chloroflexota bacterium]